MNNNKQEIDHLVMLYRKMVPYPREDEFMSFDDHVLWGRGDGGTELLHCRSYDGEERSNAMTLIAALLEFIRNEAEHRPWPVNWPAT